MKRMHIHVAVADLNQSIRFYSELFGAPPTVHKPDYAKWMMEDPRINFAISARGIPPGIDHLGIQVESDEALESLRGQLERAGMSMVTQEATACCYSESNKHWITDPQGIAWETFHTLKEVPTFGAAEHKENSPCCTPAIQTIRLLSRRSDAGKAHD
jgi:catechol 2,3-dioxygenase-like lactoylglutathione lyase family enzyme